MARRRRPSDEAQRVLDAATLALVAVDTGRGVHVSPQAYAWAGGRVWLLAPSDSLKVRLVRRTATAGVTVRVGETAVVLTGRARIVEAWPPAAGLAALASAGRLGVGAVAYGRRNAGVAVGVALDALAGRMGVPGPRSVIALEPSRWALVAGTDLVDHDGWVAAAPLVAGRPRRTPVALGALPRALRPLVTGATEATVGWPGPNGPVAVPAEATDLAVGRVHVVAALADLLGAPDGEGCVTVHSSPGSRPGDYRGVLLRGPLRAGGRRAGRRALTVRPTRVTWWQGYRSATAPVGSQGR